MNNKVGANIVKYRKINGMSQKYLANLIGISCQGLHKIEKGEASPRTGTIEKICESLCITPNQLFGVDEINEKNINILSRLRQMKDK